VAGQGLSLDQASKRCETIVSFVGVNYHKNVIVVMRKPGTTAHHGLLRVAGRTLVCAFGRTGPTIIKREGDGATPAFYPMRPQHVFYRADRVQRPRTRLPVSAIRQIDGWCDAPGHPSYNMAVTLPFGASHEIMWRDDELYDICVVLDHNRPPNARIRNRGSAIFLHCAKPGYLPTAGCIALKRADLQRVLIRLTAQSIFYVRR